VIVNILLYITSCPCDIPTISTGEVKRLVTLNASVRVMFRVKLSHSEVQAIINHITIL